MASDVVRPGESIPVAEGVQPLAPVDAEDALQGFPRVVDAGVDDADVVRARLLPGAGQPGGRRAGRQNRPAQTWLQAVSPQYTLHYVSEFESDVAFVQRWLDATEQLMLDKYSVGTHGVTVNIYLEPAPTGYVGVGRAVIYTHEDQDDRQAEIHYMTPSSPAWEQARREGWTTGIGRPFDDHYHAKTLVHEYVTIAHQHVRKRKDSGWTRDAPLWFAHGLEEYDGLFHTTPENRTDGPAHLMRYADAELRARIHCCQTLAEPTIGTTDPHFGGVVILLFLAESYGERIHADLL